MSDHTKGPWSLREGFIVANYEDYLAEGGSESWEEIAEVINQGVHTEANVHLLAAAPELLEAIKELMPKGWGKDDTMDHMPGVKKARLAIAKAEGKS